MALSHLDVLFPAVYFQRMLSYKQRSVPYFFPTFHRQQQHLYVVNWSTWRIYANSQMFYANRHIGEILPT